MGRRRRPPGVDARCRARPPRRAFERRRAQLPDELAGLLERSAADVGLLAGPAPDWTRGEGVFVPFGGGVHDWAALELAAWLAAAADLPLRLVGTKADASLGRRMRAGCSPMRRSRSSASSASPPSRCWPSRPTPRSSQLSSRRPSSCSASHRDGGWTASVRPGGYSCAMAARRRCSCTAGRVPGGLAPRESSTRFTWSIQQP